MKTLYTFALLTFFIALSTFGHAAVNDNSDYEFIADKIQASVQLPDNSDAASVQPRVLVVFSISEDGQVLVHEVGTADPELKASLITQFEAMEFDNSQKQLDGTYSIRLNFKSL